MKSTKPPSLNPTWITWCIQRHAWLCSHGLPSTTAWRWANFEAAERQRVAQFIGVHNAKAADLQIDVVGAVLKFSLKGRCTDLSETQADRLDENVEFTIELTV